MNLTISELNSYAENLCSNTSTHGQWDERLLHRVGIIDNSDYGDIVIVRKLYSVMNIPPPADASRGDILMRHRRSYSRYNA